MAKCETRKQLSYSRLGTGISQENGGLNLPLVWQSLIVPSYWQMGGGRGGFFVCILHKFAYLQIKQDGLEFQILGPSWLLDFPDLSRLIPMPPPPICQYDGTINDCHTSGRFDPPFSWEMPLPSREYDSCFLVSQRKMNPQYPNLWKYPLISPLFFLYAHSRNFIIHKYWHTLNTNKNMTHTHPYLSIWRNY
jgi:hypothetical protein